MSQADSVTSVRLVWPPADQQIGFQPGLPWTWGQSRFDRREWLLWHVVQRLWRHDCNGGWRLAQGARSRR